MAINDNTSYELTGLQVKDLAQKIRAKADSSSLATVATSGSYTDLTNTPTIPAAQVNSDWNANSGVAQILNKPTLAAVATSGDYADLSNTPTIPTVNDATLTITQNGTTAGTFTANSSSDTTISLTDTTYTHFTGATSSADGTQGLVPGPLAGDQDKVLHGDGTWKTVQSGSTKRILTWDNGAMYDEDYNAISGGDVYAALQSGDVEVVEANSMTSSLIVENGIYASWTDPTYGTLTNVFFFTTEQTSLAGVMTRTQYLYDEASGNGWLTPRTMNIQEQLTAGSNISISGNTISATVKLVEMAYGESNAWAKFIAAYNAGSIVYCRASSNSNPGSGSQTRKAFMAYVNNATSPTSVEFQYVRSVSSKTDSQQCDQVFVYTLTNASGGTWSVASRNMAPKINVSGPITKTFSNGANATVTIGADAMTGATSSAAGTAGVVPAPTAGDDTKFLSGDGSWKSAGGEAISVYSTANQTITTPAATYGAGVVVPLTSTTAMFDSSLFELYGGGVRVKKAGTYLVQANFMIDQHTTNGVYAIPQTYKNANTSISCCYERSYSTSNIWYGGSLAARVVSANANDVFYLRAASSAANYTYRFASQNCTFLTVQRIS